MTFFVQNAGLDFWNGVQTGNIKRVEKVLKDDFLAELPSQGNNCNTTVTLDKDQMIQNIQESVLTVDSILENRFKHRFLTNALKQDVYCIEYEEVIHAVSGQDHDIPSAKVKSKGVQVWRWELILSGTSENQKTKAVFTNLVLYQNTTITDLKKSGELIGRKAQQKVPPMDEKSSQPAVDSWTNCSIQ